LPDYFVQGRNYPPMAITYKRLATLGALTFLTHFMAMAQQKIVLHNNKEVISEFLEVVRAGKDPDKASVYMADTILAHQMNAERPATVKRTPQNYADHIREFIGMYGDFTFEITELIAEGDKVYARWLQNGKHLAEIDGHPATGKPLIEIASAVYRLENSKIVEYWIQIDRLGFEKQLLQNEK